MVVTRQADWHAEGALRAGSITEAMQMCPPETDAWVIGGAEIYAQALPWASTAVVTEIDQDFEGDAFAPALNADWQEVHRTTHVAASGLTFSFVTYQNTSKGD